MSATDVGPLVEFFRDEGYAFGREGDHNGWPPEKTAIHFLRQHLAWREPPKPPRADAEMAALLTILEWGDEDRPGCPFCGMGESDGHLSRCQLSAALAKARGEQA